MNHSHRRIVLTSAVALVALLAYLRPASAMGRSGNQPLQPSVASTPAEIPAGITTKSPDAALQSQVDTLRKELADLRTQVATLRGVASND